MKVYKVKVNGKVYEVELEAVSESGNKIAAPSTPVSAPQPQANANGQVVNAPMAGNIIKVNVAVGDQVKKGDVLLVLEAMKLENDIVAPVAGTVNAIAVSKGQVVTNGQKLVVIG